MTQLLFRLQQRLGVYRLLQKGVCPFPPPPNTPLFGSFFFFLRNFAFAKNLCVPVQICTICPLYGTQYFSDIGASLNKQNLKLAPRAPREDGEGIPP